MSWSTKRWMKRLDKTLRKSGKSVPFGLCFVTHMRPVEKINSHVIKFHNYLKGVKSIKNLYPEPLLAQVVDIEGPIKSGVLKEAKNYGLQFAEWIDK